MTSNLSPLTITHMDGLPYAEFEALLIMQNRLLSDLESRLRSYDLSSSGFLALRLIAHHSAPRRLPITRARIAEHLGIAPASVTPLIRRMLERRWVLEETIDARATGLRITPDGQRKLYGGMVAWEDAFSELDAAMTASMKSQLMRTITKINVVDQHRRDEERRLMLMRTATVRDTLDVLSQQNRDAKAKARKIEQELDAD